jgi:transposase
MGSPHGQIAELVGVIENTLREYFELYQQGGLEKLKELNYYQTESKLNTHITSLEAHFRENPPANIKEAQSEIETITGLKRSETQVAEGDPHDQLLLQIRGAVAEYEHVPNTGHGSERLKKWT